MKTVKAVTCSILILSAEFSGANGATPNFDWHKVGDPGYAPSVTTDGTGNIIWGYAYLNSTQDKTFYALRKLSNSGSPIWSSDLQTQFGGASSASLSSDASGNVVAILARPTYYSSPTSLWWSAAFARITANGTAAFSTTMNPPIGWGNFTEPFHLAASADSAGNSIFVFPYVTFTYGGIDERVNDGDTGILKLSPSGSIVWFKRVAGPGLDVPTGVVSDSDGNVYVSGFGDGTMAFDATILTSNGGRDGFLAKYDKDGTLVWVKHPTCAGSDSISSLALGTDGFLWFAGSYSGSLSFGNTINSTTGGWYVGRVDTSGVQMSVANLVGVSDVTKIAPSVPGRVVATGKYSGTSIFGTTVQNYGADDVYVAEVSTTGVAQWIKTLGYVYGDVPGGVAVSPAGETYVAASVGSGVILDGVFVSAGGSGAAVLAKLVSPSLSQLPLFRTQPQSIVVSGGMNIQLTAAATGDLPITYQWWFNGAPLTGQTSASLLIPNAKPENAGSYYVVAKNGAGETPSQVANVSYSDAAELQLTMHPSLTIFGTAGKTYRIDYTVETRAAQVWTTVTNITLPSSPYVWQDNTVGIGDKRFYRVVLQ